MSRFAAVLCSSLAGFAVGCSDGGANDPRIPEGEEPSYVLHSVVEGPAGGNSYFTLLPSLEALAGDAMVRYDESLELPGYARLFGRDDAGWFAIGSGEEPTVTRVEVRDRAFDIGQTVSFQGVGTTSLLRGRMHFVSATKAYYLDPEAEQVVVWNPAELSVERTVPFGLPARQGGYLLITNPIETDGRLLVGAGWRNGDWSGALDGVALLQIDVENDTVSFSEDERCSALGTAALTTSGDVYFFTNNLRAIQRAAQEAPADDCVLRVSAGQNRFDADYRGSMAGSLGGRYASVVLQRDADHVWALALDETIFRPQPGVTYGEFHAAPAWRRYRVALSDLSAFEEPSQMPGAFNGAASQVGDRVVWSQPKADYSESVLLDATGDELIPGVRFPGYFSGALRLRP